MSDVIAFPRRMYDTQMVAERTHRTETEYLSMRPSLPTARAKSMADQIADLARALRHEVENNTPPGGNAA